MKGNYVKWNGLLAKIEDVLLTSIIIKVVRRSTYHTVSLNEVTPVHIQVVRDLKSL